MLSAVYLKDLAVFAADVDAQFAAGWISAVERGRFLGDIEAILIANGWGWDTIAAVGGCPLPPARPLEELWKTSDGQRVLFMDELFEVVNVWPSPSEKGV
jgi:hypothetical protein